MNKLIISLSVIAYSITSFARSVNDVKQILVGEWYEENTNQPCWTKYNANGTGSFMIYAYLFEDSLGDFTWTLADENTLVCILPNNKVSRESISIIDNNTILLNGDKYIRRGTKKTSANSSAKPTKNVAPRVNADNKYASNTSNLNGKPHTPFVNATKPIVIKHVYNADDFSDMYQNLIGLPYDFRDSNITDIKSYCNNNGYAFSSENLDRLKLIQVSNPVTEIFGLNFEVRIYESNGFVFNNGKHVKMSLEWYSKPYASIVQMNSDFQKFTDKIEKSGGVFKGYDESCQRSIYIFPNGVKIEAKAWEHNKVIQMFVNLQ